MEPQRVFMTAEWVNLVMMNYSVDPGLLEPLVPHGTILDHFDGKVYVSLIGFEFNRSRIYGVPIPFHQSFEEVNLRFYVRRGEKRGAAFIKELVPKRAVAAIARFAFNENYSYVPMAHRVERGALERFRLRSSRGGVSRSVRRCAFRLREKAFWRPRDP
jgi:uncharacterized protein YqjF (DUF2071 family)